MQKREKILAVITLVSAVFFIFNQFVCAQKSDPASSRQRPKRSQPAPSGQMAIRGEQISDAELRRRLKNWQPVVTYNTWGRDPFEGALKFEEADSMADSTATLSLNGIVWKNDTPLALIGDLILGVGDKSGGIEVLKILPDRVIARQGTEVLTLHLHQDEKNDGTTPDN